MCTLLRKEGTKNQKKCFCYLPDCFWQNAHFDESISTNLSKCPFLTNRFCQKALFDKLVLTNLSKCPFWQIGFDKSVKMPFLPNFVKFWQKCPAKALIWWFLEKKTVFNSRTLWIKDIFFFNDTGEYNNIHFKTPLNQRALLLMMLFYFKDPLNEGAFLRATL